MYPFSVLSVLSFSFPFSSFSHALSRPYRRIAPHAASPAFLFPGSHTSPRTTSAAPALRPASDRPLPLPTRPFLILGFREHQAKLPHMPINTRHRPPYKTPNARPDHYRLRQTDIIRSPHGSFPALAPRPFAHLASPLPLLALLPTTPCPLTPLLLPCAFVRPLPPAALCPFAPFLRAPLLLLYRLRSPCPPATPLPSPRVHLRHGSPRAHRRRSLPAPLPHHSLCSFPQFSFSENF